MTAGRCVLHVGDEALDAANERASISCCIEPPTPPPLVDRGVQTGICTVPTSAFEEVQGQLFAAVLNLNAANQRAVQAEQRAVHAEQHAAQLAAQLEEMQLAVHNHTAEHNHTAGSALQSSTEHPRWDWDCQSLSPWVVCTMCNGSGENSFDNSTCWTCLGEGRVRD